MTTTRAARKLAALGACLTCVAAPMAALGPGAMAAPAPAPKPFVQHVQDFQLSDQNGKSHDLYAMAGAKAVVIYTQMNGCPIVRNTSAAFKQLRDEYKAKGVEFLMLNSSLQDDPASIRAEGKEWGFDDVPILKDPKQTVGVQLGVTRTAEAFVIDPRGWKVVYRGPLDDRVVYERQKPKADHTWAKDGIDAVLAGRPAPVAEQQVLGCIIDFPARDHPQG
jgi:peroxiredoxin